MTASTTVPAVTASNIGLIATATNFASSDKGCMPLIGAAAATQTATVQIVLQGGLRNSFKHRAPHCILITLEQNP